MPTVNVPLGSNVYIDANALASNKTLAVGPITPGVRWLGPLTLWGSADSFNFVPVMQVGGPGATELQIDCALRFYYWLPNVGSNVTASLPISLSADSPFGTSGSQGPQGAQGVQGAQGNQGTQGVQGFQGSTGTGTQGPQGFQGSQGAQGNQGSNGTGAQGAQGAQGFQGNQGFQGSDGATGAQGNQGFQGATGSTGAQGNQGFQGFQGFQGNAGSAGAQGAQGSQGVQGTQGFQGTQGNQGTQGAQGSQGATGVPTDMRITAPALAASVTQYFGANQNQTSAANAWGLPAGAARSLTTLAITGGAVPGAGNTVTAGFYYNNAGSWVSMGSASIAGNTAGSSQTGFTTISVSLPAQSVWQVALECNASYTSPIQVAFW